MFHGPKSYHRSIRLKNARVEEAKAAEEAEEAEVRVVLSFLRPPFYRRLY
jgi:hypothetical protein